MDDQGSADRALGRYRASGTTIVLGSILWGLLLLVGVLRLRAGETGVLTWVLVVGAVTVLAALWLLPATVIGPRGVRVRLAPLRWARFTWSEIVAVLPPGSGESSILVRVTGRSALVSLDGVGRDRLVGVVLLARRGAAAERQP